MPQFYYIPQRGQTFWRKSLFILTAKNALLVQVTPTTFLDKRSSTTSPVSLHEFLVLSAAQNMDPPKSVPADCCVVVVGKAGSGKSTVCNKILTGTADGPFQISNGPFAEQTDFKSHHSTIENEKVVNVVDCPDVLNMGYSEGADRHKFEQWKTVASMNVPIVFVLTVRLDMRFTPEDYALYTKYMKMLPEQCNVMLALTYTEGLKSFLQEELRMSAVSKLLNEVGGRYVAFSSTDTKEDCTKNKIDIISSAKKIQYGNLKQFPSSLHSQVKQPEYRVVVVGKVGSGKSTVCNKLLTGTADGPFEVYTGVTGEMTTQFSSHHRPTDDGCIIHIIDSPDVFNMGYTNGDAQSKFDQWKIVVPGDVPTVFVFTLNLNELLTPNDTKLYRQYLQLVPAQYKNNVILAFTFTENLKNGPLEEMKLSPASELLDDFGGRHVAFSRHDTKENCATNATVIINNTKTQPEDVRIKLGQVKQPEYRVVVVGKVGSGKSTVCNKLLTGTADGPFKIFTGVTGEMTTQFSSHCTTLSDGSVLHVVDSPDVFNMGYKQPDALTKFEQWKTIVPEDIPTVFIFTVKLSERFTPHDQKLYEQYLHLVPEQYRQNAMAALTFTENLKNQLAMEISLSPVSKFIEDVGRRYAAFSMQDSEDECRKNTTAIISNAKKARTEAKRPIPSSFHREVNLPVYRIVVLGKVGSGKSTVCNKLLTGTADGPFKVYTGVTGEQTTQFSTEVRTDVDKILHVVDSPDVFNLGYSEAEARDKFEEWYAVAPWDMPTIFVATVRIDQRFETPDRKLYDQYLQLIPEKYRFNVMVAFTFTKGFQQRELEEEIKKSEVYHLPGVAEGRYVAFSEYDSRDKISIIRDDILNTSLIVPDRPHDTIEGHTSSSSKKEQGMWSRITSYAKGWLHH